MSELLKQINSLAVFGGLRQKEPLKSLCIFLRSTETPGTKLEDVLERLGLEKCYFKLSEITDDNINKVYDLADEFLLNPQKEYIKLALDKEAQSAEKFFDMIGAGLKDDREAYERSI